MLSVAEMARLNRQHDPDRCANGEDHCCENCFTLLYSESQSKINDRPAPSSNGVHNGRLREFFKNSDDAPLTDVGNGQRFASDHRDKVRHCHPWSKWLVWDGRRWAPDDTGKIKANAKQTVLAMFNRAKQQIDALKRDDSEDAAIRVKSIQAMLAHAIKSQDAKKINAMLDLARSEPGIPILPDALDRDPWLFNCVNGTLDLRTGNLRPHSQSDSITKICPVKFDRLATCPTWERTLREIFELCLPIVDYLQRLCGYWMTGVTTEHILPVFWGGGANGKSTILNTLFDVMGPDYSGKASRDLLTEAKGSKHPTALAWLHGKRLVGGIETSEGARLDEALVKELTGGDTVTARRMREDFWEFRPTHKIALATNHKPTIRGTDHAIWRRLRLIPFERTFRDEEQDKQLGEKLRAESPGILNWMLAGCLMWQRSGLQDPDEVKAPTAEYRGEQDRLADFLAERCQLNREFRVKSSDLYCTYKAWCESNGERYQKKTGFTQALGERGIVQDDGRRWYLGIALASDCDD